MTVTSILHITQVSESVVDVEFPNFAVPQTGLQLSSLDLFLPKYRILAFKLWSTSDALNLYLKTGLIPESDYLGTVEIVSYNTAKLTVNKSHPAYKYLKPGIKLTTIK